MHLIKEFLPEWSHEAPFLLQNWQWLGMALLLFAGLAADLGARALAAWIRQLLCRRFRLEREAHDSLTKCRRPLGAVAGMFVLVIGLPGLEFDGQGGTILLGAARGGATLAVVWLLMRVVDVLGSIAAARAALTTNQLDDLLVPLVRKTCKTLVVIFGAVYFALSVNLEIAPLLAGLGLSSLAIGFAAKSTVENLFGSLTVILDRPFQIGDFVAIGGVEGTVESMGLRSTRIRTSYDSLLVIPNSTILTANVDNYGRRRYRRFKAHLTVDYGTPPATLQSFVEALRSTFPTLPHARQDGNAIVVHDYSQTGVVILINVFFEASTWDLELASRERFILEVSRIAERIGVRAALLEGTATIGLQPITPSQAATTRS